MNTTGFLLTVPTIYFADSCLICIITQIIPGLKKFRIRILSSAAVWRRRQAPDSTEAGDSFRFFIRSLKEYFSLGGGGAGIGLPESLTS